MPPAINDIFGALLYNYSYFDPFRQYYIASIVTFFLFFLSLVFQSGSSNRII